MNTTFEKLVDLFTRDHELINDLGGTRMRYGEYKILSELFDVHAPDFKINNKITPRTVTRAARVSIPYSKVQDDISINGSNTNLVDLVLLDSKQGENLINFIKEMNGETIYSLGWFKSICAETYEPCLGLKVRYEDPER